ncbi:hypothetical protein OS493_012318 [Desmophyllum pertusum]|uniref:Uncharacterized protein n=1 Tax=Desmophyllum pertusum TaxID=174260 RepID=A0A9W9ZR51_9CNID|nr:hypothetical protein OS493_012318 [Desmophyllum pertusum]
MEMAFSIQDGCQIKLTFQPPVTMAPEGLQSPNLAEHRYSTSSIDRRFENARFFAESHFKSSDDVVYISTTSHNRRCHCPFCAFFGVHLNHHLASKHPDDAESAQEQAKSTCQTNQLKGTSTRVCTSVATTGVSLSLDGWLST